MKVRTLTAIGFIAVALGIYWHVMYGPTEFNRSVWLRVDNTSGAPRLRMADGLLESKMLLSKSRSEIIAMLGPPATTEHFRESGLVYWLGPERGFMSIDSEWLTLDFDAAGRVRDVHIVTD